MEAISIKEVSMNEIKVYSDRTEDDNRRYAYEKAIEAYWKHVDRYHTWMNYYAIFNGALFVGFCTLLTATTKVIAKTGSQQNNYDTSFINAKFFELENSYFFILIILCIIGSISGISWLLSLKGHITWMNNWMNIIHKYEDTTYRVYKIIVASSQDIIESNEVNSPHSSNMKLYKAYSTSTITEYFVTSIILGWLILIIQLIYMNISEDIGVLLYILLFLFLLITMFVKIVVKNGSFFTFLYSETSDKVIYKYDKSETIIYK